MLIPIGVVESEVRRTPWVSIGLLVVLVTLYFAGVRGGLSPKQAREASRELAGAAEFWLEHPWLNAPAALEGLIGGELLKTLSDEVGERHRVAVARRVVPISYVVARQQEELDGRVEAATRLLRSRSDLGLSFVPSRPSIGGLVGHMFLHGDLWHLLGNVLFLFVTAAFLEDVYGRVLFSLLFVVGGLSAAGAHGLLTLRPDLPLVGASGALAAVMGAFLIRLGRSHIRFLFIPILFLPVIRFRFALPAFVVLPLWLGEQVLSARLFPDAPVAWWAHIGGFAFGMAVATGLKLFDVEERWIDPSIEARIGWSQDPAILKANDARAAGAFVTARNSARAALAKEPGNVDAWRSLLDTELVSGRRPEAAGAAARLIERYVAAGENGLAIALDEEVGETLADVLPARFFLAAASARERAGDDDGAWRVLEGLVARSPKDPASVRAALKMAGFARRAGMTPEALDLLDWGRSHPACEPGFREAASRAEEELLRTSPEPPGARRSLPVRRFAAWGEPRAFPAH